LLKDLNDHNAARTLQAKASVLSDDLALVVLGNDLVSISRWSSKDIEHDVLDGVSQSAEFLRCPAFLDINTDQRHKIT